MIYDLYISDADGVGRIYDDGSQTFRFNELDADTAEVLTEVAMKDGYLVVVPQPEG